MSETDAAGMVKYSDVIAVIRTEWFRKSPGLRKALVTAEVLNVLKGHLTEKEIAFPVWNAEDYYYEMYSPSRILIAFFDRKGDSLIPTFPGTTAYRIQNGLVLNWPIGQGRDPKTGNVPCHRVLKQIAKLSHQKPLRGFLCPELPVERAKPSTMTKVFKLAKESTAVASVTMGWIEPKAAPGGRTLGVFRIEIGTSICGLDLRRGYIMSIIGSPALRNSYEIGEPYIVFLKRVGKEWRFADESMSPLQLVRGSGNVRGLQIKKPITYKELRSQIIHAVK